MDIAFNDGSLDEVFTKDVKRQEAKESFLRFVRKINEMKRANLIDTLFVTYNVVNYSLSEGYTVRDWLNDKTINMNYRQFLRSYLGRVVYIYKNKICCEAKVKYLTHEIDSVGGAFIRCYSDDPIVISVVSHEFWEKDEFPIMCEYLNEEGDICNQKIHIKNVSEKTDICCLENEKRKEIFDSITSGQDFWENKEKLFPNLIFCEPVKKQVYEDCEKYHIVRVMERLMKMQEYFSKEHKIYKPDELGMEARTESDTVKKDSHLREQRLFRLPTGEEKYFFDHIGFTGKYSGGRIHFYPDVKNKRAYIGYIGRHLETKKF